MNEITARRIGELGEASSWQALSPRFTAWTAQPDKGPAALADWLDNAVGAAAAQSHELVQLLQAVPWRVSLGEGGPLTFVVRTSGLAWELRLHRAAGPCVSRIVRLDGQSPSDTAAGAPG